jgi:hypothetical protein
MTVDTTAVGSVIFANPSSHPNFVLTLSLTFLVFTKQIIQVNLAMASKELFAKVPPFPNEVATMPMHTVSLAGLNRGQDESARQILSACRELGFFLLDLHGDDLGETMIREIDHLFSVGQDIFDLSEDVKQQYLHDAPRSFLG